MRSFFVILTGFEAYSIDMANMRKDGEFNIYFARPLSKYYSSTVTEEAIIPVEKVHGKMLLLYGADDGILDVSCCVDNIYSRLKNYGKENISKLIIYTGAGHLIEPPHSFLCRISDHPLMNSCIDWAGSPHAHAKAQEHSWEEIKKFLAENIC